MLNFSGRRRQEFIEQKKERQLLRLKIGKTNILKGEQRTNKRNEKLKERFKLESQRMRGYELIFPCVDKTKKEKYDQYLKKSNEIWDDLYTGKHRRIKYIE